MTAAPPAPKYLTTGEAAAYLATKGIPVSRQTIRNWMAVGCIRDGRRVYLRHLKVGHLITRRKWLREFLEASQRVPAAHAPTPGPARTETPDAQAERFRREKEQAQEFLRRRPRKAKARTP